MVKFKLFENNKWRFKAFWRQLILLLYMEDEGEKEGQIKWNPGEVVFHTDSTNYYLDCPRIIPLECKSGKTSFGCCIPYKENKIMVNLPAFRLYYYIGYCEEDVCGTIVHEYIHRLINEETKTNKEIQKLINENDNKYGEFNEKITTWMTYPELPLEFNFVKID